jgi:hypothetical protein
VTGLAGTSFKSIIGLRLSFVLSLLFALTTNLSAQDICLTVNGSIILAQDSKNTFLGKITNSLDSQSIFNEFGTYGSEFSTGSVWNQFSIFGNEFNSYSPHNEFSSNPPMIIKDGKLIGYLSANKSIRSSISPNLLKALCKEKF